jgi:hypothetical protein
MADDLDKAIKSIAQMLGMSSNQAGAQQGAGSGSSLPNVDTSIQPMSSSPARDNVSVLAKARDMLDAFNYVSDSRINLLNSIHPFLSPARQASCSSCVQLLKIVAVLSSFSQGNKDSGPKG